MKTFCIRRSEENCYIQLHSWMFDLCEGNRCAALLLAFFAGWYDWKLKHDSYYQRYNDIAETHEKILYEILAKNFVFRIFKKLKIWKN